MSTNVVNLDALIPRDDFTVEGQSTAGKPLDTISIVHLEGPFFGPDLRKPDFQRETIHWSPAKVVDLLRAFVDGDLIPAVILWRAGRYIFVVDGAHRLSALLAWILDDYGDRKKSLDYFGGHITDEQRKIADRTRVAVNKEIGSYQEYLAARSKPESAPEKIKKRLSNLSVVTVIAQWVPATDAASAEASFFKINQAATPIDPTERRILKARLSASAITARAITHAGTGHKYWSSFSKPVQAEIEKLAKSIYTALYDPPMGGSTVTTLDVPVAGRGYNALPFIFDLVNEANSVSAVDTSTKRDVKEELPEDKDGTLTIRYLQSVADRVERITGDTPKSLGLHPVVYFYTRSGAFQPIAFIGTSIFIERIVAKGKLREFAKHRSAFEEFLIDKKEALSLMIHKFGTGARSIPWVVLYYEFVFTGLRDGESAEEIQNALAKNPDFAFLTAPRPSGVRVASTKAKHFFSSGTKTATYFASALPGCVRCQECSARVHRNSMHFDHKVKASERGAGDMSNAQVTHPWCDSAKR